MRVCTPFYRQRCPLYLEDIFFEREKTANEYAYEAKRTPDYSDGMLEETAVYRKIAEQMPIYDTFVFHGSAIAVDGEGYLFTAKSGSGKFSHTRLWREMLDEKAVMVNDDKPLIKCADYVIMIYGTPYNGKHRLGNNIAVPLKAVCILECVEKNTIRRIDRNEAYPMLFQQMYCPSDKAALAKTLTLIDGLAEQVGLYKRDSGQYVLHRILKVREHDHVICGDNRWNKEYGITDRHIIGVLTAVIRKGKELKVTDTKYRLYVHLWCDLVPIRAFIVHVINKLKRVIRRK